MVVRVSFELKGLDEYLERIVQAGQDVDAAAGRAVKAGGDVLLLGMQRRVPKDTGNLEEHLERSEVDQDGNFVFVSVGMKPAAEVDADTARYGNAQEYGYKRGKKHYPARSYIRASFDSDKSKVRAAQKKSLQGDGVI